MKLLRLVLLLVLVSQALSLSTEEVQALQAVFRAWPGLQHQTPPWTQLVSAACRPPGFYGVTCSTDAESVIGLSFNSSSLSGSLPLGINGLAKLETLSITEGCLLGAVPVELVQLTRLKTLILWPSFNYSCAASTTSLPYGLSVLTSLEVLQWRATFTGRLPPGLAALTSLRILKLAHVPTYQLLDGLEGDFPDNLSELTQLEVFHIEHLALMAPTTALAATLQEFVVVESPKFNGYLQFLLESAHGLKVLNGSASSFYGSMSFLGALSNLTYFNMHKAYLLHAGIPNSMWSLRNLEFIDLSYCGATLELTPDIRGLKKLRHLRIAEANLFGNIPEEIGLLESLNFLEISAVPLDSQHLPQSLGLLKNLTHLRLSGAYFDGPIPASLGDATNLEVLDLSSNILNATIPSSIYSLPHLTKLILADNKLQGQLSEFSAKLQFVDLSHNLLSGAIPHTIATTTSYLDLSQNQFGPLIPYHTFANNTNRPYIDISDNFFECELFSSPAGANIIAHHNKFYGGIPSDYCYGRVLNLNFNNLYGTLDYLLPFCSFTEISLRSNNFSGTLPSLEKNTALETFDISLNRLTGPLPAFAPTLRIFDGSYNRFAGPISEDFGRCILDSKSIVKIDLGWNELECPKSHYLSSYFYTPLKHLHIPHNKLSCQLQQYSDRLNSRSNLVGLDLSHNLLFGQFHAASYPSLVSLKLMFNTLDGPFVTGLSMMPAITELDISFNLFIFDASILHTAPYLIALNAQSNYIMGSFKPHDLPSLQTADLSMNDLTAVDLKALGYLMTSQSLKLASIEYNLKLMPYDSLYSNTTGLTRTKQSEPLQKLFSRQHKVSNYTDLGVVCYSLSFSTSPEGRSLLYDVDLFSYSQCDCDDGHFGVPPLNCFACPLASSSCKTNQTVIPENEFSFIRLPASSNGTDLLKVRTETCIVTTAQAVTGKTNCRGLVIDGPKLAILAGRVERAWNVDPTRIPQAASLPLNDSVALAEMFQMQCHEGSEGRLCSRCTCTPQKCYYLRGTECRRCSVSLAKVPSALLATSIFVIMVLLLTIAMFFVLKSHRVRGTKVYHKLPLYKRVLYRFLLLKSLGNVTILITFLQLLSQLTHWDSYVLRQALLLVNGGGANGLGLQCIFPFMASPFGSLLFRLSLPFLVIAILGISVSLAAVLLHQWTPQIDAPPVDSRSDLSSGWSSFRDGDEIKLHVPFPAKALFVSVSLTALRFFYFETALTAHEYLFSSSQPWTSVKYVLNHPWMKYEDALPLIGASIPLVLIFDLILPLAFLFLCWKVRYRLYKREVSIYVGTLFDNFSKSCFWWEIVSILRKLAIALVLQGISPSDAFQPALIVTILIGAQFMQVSLAPWRRRAENFADNISAALLVGSMLATRTTALSHSSAVLYIAGALDVLFIVASLVIVAYLTFVDRTTYHAQFDEWLAHKDTSPSIIPYEINSTQGGAQARDILHFGDTSSESDEKAPLMRMSLNGDHSDAETTASEDDAFM